MRYLLLIIAFIVAIAIKILSTSSFLEKPALAITSLPIISNSWKITQTYIPPDRGAPESTTTGGTRGGQCLLSQAKIIPLLIPGNSFGVTLSEYPTFFAYIPPSQEAQEGEFFLAEWFSRENQQDIYNEHFQLPDNAGGIIGLKIPAEKSPPLQLGKKYIWGVRIFCDPEKIEQDGDPLSKGFIELIQPNLSLLERLKNARPLTLPTIYAAQGIWYDALASLMELRSLNPQNSQLINDWQELLNSAKSEGRETFMEAPLLECCQLKD